MTQILQSKNSSEFGREQDILQNSKALSKIEQHLKFLKEKTTDIKI